MQKKPLRTMQIKGRMAHSNPLFLKLNIIKLLDKVKIDNCVLISKHANCKWPPIFSNYFKFQEVLIIINCFYFYRNSQSS